VVIETDWARRSEGGGTERKSAENLDVDACAASPENRKTAPTNQERDSAPKKGQVGVLRSTDMWTYLLIIGGEGGGEEGRGISVEGIKGKSGRKNHG